MTHGGRPPAVVTLATAPSEAEFTAIFQALEAETAQTIGPSQIEPLAILLHDHAGQVVGGLWGRVVYAWLVVEMLFVPAALRGRGLGAALMQAAESAARSRNCVGLQLTRLDFQAPAFYERLGFETFGVLDDVPPGHRCFHMQKRLAAPDGGSPISGRASG
jgi:GNAT superfamily N-acetyltransferase